MLPIAEKGIVGRGVLIDMARHRGKDTLDKGETFDHTDLRGRAAAQGVTIEPHDVLVIRTGWMKYWYEQGQAFYDGFCEPGLTYCGELVQWFQDREIPNLVTDTIANEVTFDPETGVALPLHCALMRNLGVTLTEIAWLDDLADACAEDGRWTFLYVAAPLKVVNGIGLPGQPGGHPVSRGVYAASPGWPATARASPRRSPSSSTALLAIFEATVARDAGRRRDPLLRRHAHLRASSTRLRRVRRWACPTAGSPPATGWPSTCRTCRSSSIALIGTWKAGGIAVSINPMNKARELTDLLTDSGATALLCLDEPLPRRRRRRAGRRRRSTVITTSELDHQTRNDPRIFAGVDADHPRGHRRHAPGCSSGSPGRRRRRCQLGPDDIAFLTYTSGTTGPPKGAMTTHRNVVVQRPAPTASGCGLGPDDVVLGVAPLFHITGLIGHVAIALLVGCPLVLVYRFDPAVVIETIREHRPTFTVGAIAVFIALSNSPGADREDFGVAARDLLRRGADRAGGHRPAARRSSASTSTTSTG